MVKCDFSGWATRNDLRCGDGRIIKRDAFAHNHGKTVSLIWNHQHDDPDAVLGHALLENRNEGVYAYCTFNDTASGKKCKELVQHGDVSSLSIYANKLKQNGLNVIHGEIRELSLVLAGANPGAKIDYVMAHSDIDGEDRVDGLYAWYDENILIHSADTAENKEDTSMATNKSGGEKTVAEVFDTLNEEQKTVVYAMIGQALEDAGVSGDNEDEGEEDMKHNVFDNDYNCRERVLTHSDMNAIVGLAQQPGMGSFKTAMQMYVNNDEDLQHSVFNEDGATIKHSAFSDEVIGLLFPEYELIDPKEPKIIWPDDSWVGSVMSGVHKSPYSRVRTRRADARQADLRAKGYANKGDYKKEMNHINLLGRTFDPQTIYIKDKTHRDDVLEIKGEFDYLAYNYNIMQHQMKQTLATAILIGDGRDDLDPDKIKEAHLHSIWNDDEFYCMHRTINIAATKAELQGTDTAKYFGDQFVYVNAFIDTAGDALADYKGSGSPTLYISPKALRDMKRAKDRNGRRIYANVSEIADAIGVKHIVEVEQFNELTRTASNGKTMKMHGLIVNLADYQLGCPNGCEITKFENFDLDFNVYTQLLETRLSGGLVEPYSAIALETEVTG